MKFKRNLSGEILHKVRTNPEIQGIVSDISRLTRWKHIRKYLLACGFVHFKKYEWDTEVSDMLMRNDRLGIIIKSPYILTSNNRNDPFNGSRYIDIKGICPTIRIPVEEAHPWVYIQPICNCDPVDNYHVELMHDMFRTSKYQAVLWDCTSQNVGIYRGNPVIFDW